MSDLYPDPIAEPLPRRRMPRWFWIALAPVGLVVSLIVASFVVGFFLAIEEAVETARGQSAFDCPHETYPDPTAADRAAVLNVRDLPAELELDAELATLERIHYENCTDGLEYAFDDDEAYVYSSIDEEASVEEAEATCGILRVDGEPGYERADELFRWGDRSDFYVYSWEDAPAGYLFVGRRGTRVVWAEWGGGAYEPLSAAQLEAFLAPIVERMAEHEL